MSASISHGGGQSRYPATPLRQWMATVQAVDQGGAPAVAVAAGFGQGGGASVTNQGRDPDRSQGLIECRVGLAPAASGSVSLQFPAAAPAAAGGFFCAADWAALTVTQANPLAIAWTATRALVPGEYVNIAYQWRGSV